MNAKERRRVRRTPHTSRAPAHTGLRMLRLSPWCAVNDCYHITVDMGATNSTLRYEPPCVYSMEDFRRDHGGPFQYTGRLDLSEHHRQAFGPRTYP